MKKIILCLAICLFSLNVNAFPYLSEDSSISVLPDDNIVLSAQWLKEEYTKNPTGNIVVSPMSVYLISTLLQSGAESETLKELTEFLNTSSKRMHPEEYVYQNPKPYKNNAVSDYLNTLSGSIQISNSLWGNFFKESFKQNAQDIFKAETFPLPQNTSEINTFVSEKTHGKINHILQERPLSPKDNLFLVNTVYFKDEWQIPFEAYATKKAEFQTPTKKKEVAMMHHIFRSLPYFENEKIQAIALPYKNGDKMYLILPKKEVSFSEFMRELSYKDIFLNMRDLPVLVKLPRFKIESETIDLIPYFKSNNVQRIFNPALSELGSVSDKETYVSSFLHRAVIEVDETGTEAAAATAIAMTNSAMAFGLKRQDMLLEFIADRPFIFMINDGLFIGIVNEPDDYTSHKKNMLFP
ncbi:MAG: hypothetical protein J6U64_05785 [Alphaproteobacteria bacterium]|nr:hypothetical protein [Alphaproteobacteria bacterium]